MPEPFTEVPWAKLARHGHAAIQAFAGCWRAHLERSGVGYYPEGPLGRVRSSPAAPRCGWGRPGACLHTGAHVAHCCQELAGKRIGGGVAAVCESQVTLVGWRGVCATADCLGALSYQIKGNLAAEEHDGGQGVVCAGMHVRIKPSHGSEVL